MRTWEASNGDQMWPLTPYSHIAGIQQALLVNQHGRFSGGFCGLSSLCNNLRGFSGSNSRRFNSSLLFPMRGSATGTDHQFFDDFMPLAAPIARLTSLAESTKAAPRKLFNCASVFLGA